jgi:uncharacterized protein (DUF58 family)
MRRAVGTSIAGAALTLVALTFDSTTLFVPGVAFLLLGTVVPVWVRLAARRTTIERHLEHTRVVEDEPLRLAITVRIRGRRLPDGVIHEPLAPAPIDLPRGRREFVTVLHARCGRRGRRRLDPPSVLLEDPLQLARIAVTSAGPRDEVLVLPRTARVQYAGAGAGGRRLLLGAAERPDGLAASDFDGLRPYRQGTPASRIHWPALARGAGLIERRLRPEGDTTPLVVLDARASTDGEPVDAAVRAAASLVLELARVRGCALLLPGEPRPVAIYSDLIAWPAAHVRLALVQGGPHSPAPSLRAASGRAAAIYYVAARALTQLPPEVREIDRGTVALVVPTEWGDRRPSFAVAGCYGYVLGAGGREVRAA